MGYPVWETPSGDLGTIPEANYFEFFLKAYDQTDPVRPVSFELVAGQPPVGMHINPYGSIQGNPETIIKVGGVPANVSQAVTSQFAVRARVSDAYQEFTGNGSTTKFTLSTPVYFTVYRVVFLVNQEPRTGTYKIDSNGIMTVTMNEPPAVGTTLVVSVYRSDSTVTDRTFSITVIGENAPQILSTTLLGSYQDGRYVEIDINTIDLDVPGDVLTWYISDGQLPKGLVLNSSTGIISGYIIPLKTFAFYEYKFTVTVTDSKQSDSVTLKLKVVSQAALNASSMEIKSDLSYLTIDETFKYNPILVNMVPSNNEIGPYKHDNYFMYKFEGVDWDNDSIQYTIDQTSHDGFDYQNPLDPSDVVPFDVAGFDPGGLGLPPGLTLNAKTGWLTGYLPYQSELSVTYNFFVKVYKDKVTYIEDDGSTLGYYSTKRLFQLTVVGQTLSKITWSTPQNLGSVENGAISELQIAATADNGHTLYYELKTGAYNKLPAGLELQSNGLIQGRSTFSTFKVDSDQTTFDVNSFDINETTFDQTFQFTVRAYDLEQTTSDYQTFTLRLLRTNVVPYENLYIVSKLAKTDRDALTALLINTNLIPAADIYRPSDSYFGLANNLRLLMANGIDPATAASYVGAMQKAHFNKPLYFGEIKTAVVLNPDDSIRYEVVYLEVIDNLKSSAGKDVSLAVDVFKNKVPFTADTYAIDVSDEYESVDGIRYVYPNNLDNMHRQIVRTLGQENKALPDWMRDKQPDGRILGFTTGCVLAYVKPGTSGKIAYRLNASGFDFKQINAVIDRYVWDNNLSQNFNKATGKFLSSRDTTFDVYQNKYQYTVSQDGSTLIYIKPVSFVTPVLAPDHTTLEYPYNTLVNDPSSLPNAQKTTFDKGSLQFFSYKDKYAELDQNDAYLKYPKTDILKL